MMKCCQVLQSTSIFCSVLLHTQLSKSQKAKRFPSVSGHIVVTDCNKEASENKQDAKLGLREEEGWGKRKRKKKKSTELSIGLQKLPGEQPISKGHTVYKLCSFIKRECLNY